jgi:hypothetical protein
MQNDLNSVLPLSELPEKHDEPRVYPEVAGGAIPEEPDCG